MEEAAAEGRMANVGCVGNFPLDKPIPWTQYPASIGEDMIYGPGMCMCDNVLINWEADAVIDALPDIAQLGCPIVMSALKLLLEGRVVIRVDPSEYWIFDPALDAAATAAQLLAYTYPEGEDPEGAFEFWLSPCGSSNLVVPEDIRKAYNILSNISYWTSSYKLFNIKKGSGKKGDAANPTNRSKPKAGTGSGPNGKGGSAVSKTKKCNVKPAAATKIMGQARNTLRVQSCVGPPGGASTTRMEETVITSLAFGAKTTVVERVCKTEWGQACYHYSSAIAQNPQWETLKCVRGGSKNLEIKRPGVKKWYDEHDDSC